MKKQYKKTKNLVYGLGVTASTALKSVVDRYDSAILTRKVADDLSRGTTPKRVRRLSDDKLETVIAKGEYYLNNRDKLDMTEAEKDEFLNFTKDTIAVARNELQNREKKRTFDKWAKKLID